MYADKPKDLREVLDRVSYAESLHADRVAFAREVEEVIKGNYTIPTRVKNSAGTDTSSGFGTGDIEIQRPARPLNIYRKMVQMLGVRPTVGIKVPTFGEMPTRREQKQCEKLEKGMQQYLWTLNQEHNANLVRDAMAWAGFRGVSYILSNYKPLKPDKYGLYQSFPIETMLPDPNTVFVVRGHTTAPIWFGRRTTMTVAQVKSWLSRVDASASEFQAPSLEEIVRGYRRRGRYELGREVEVAEYVDGRYRAIVIDKRHLLGDRIMEHDYGFLPLAEVPFNELPISDERWRNIPFVGRVLEDLKGETQLMGQIASAVNSILWPWLVYKSESRQPAFASPIRQGEWNEIAEDADIQVINAQINEALFTIMQGYYARNVSQGTVHEWAFLQDIPERMSGFGISQVLTVLRDQIDDMVQSAERGLSTWLGNTLRLMEKFADAQTTEMQGVDGFQAGVFVLPGYQDRESRQGKRGAAITISADDIAGHHQVEVSIKPKLPQDDIQRVTVAQQLRQPDAFGKPLADLRTALEKSELFENVNEVVERAELEWLLENDENAKRIRVEQLFAKFFGAERKDWERAQASLMRDTEAHHRAEMRLMAGMNQDVHVPEDVGVDPNFWLQMVEGLRAGLPPKQAFEAVMQQHQPGTPMQPPFADQEGASLMDQYGAGMGSMGSVEPAAGGGQSGGFLERVNQLSGGATNNDGVPYGSLLQSAGGAPTGIAGIDNRAMPPEVMGPNPRTTQEPATQQAAIEDLIRRAGKPPAR